MSAAGDQVDVGAEYGFEFGLETTELEQAHPVRQVREQVHIAVGAVLAASDAAEHPQVLDPVSRCGGGGLVAWRGAGLCEAPGTAGTWLDSWGARSFPGRSAVLSRGCAGGRGAGAGLLPG
jgi:hypothetical protein